MAKRQYIVAQELGVSQQNISDYCREKSLISAETAVRWGKILGIKPWKLIFDKDGNILTEPDRRKVLGVYPNRSGNY